MSSLSLSLFITQLLDLLPVSSRRKVHISEVQKKDRKEEGVQRDYWSRHHHPSSIRILSLWLILSHFSLHTYVGAYCYHTGSHTWCAVQGGVKEEPFYSTKDKDDASHKDTFCLLNTLIVIIDSDVAMAAFYLIPLSCNASGSTLLTAYMDRLIDDANDDHFLLSICIYTG